MTVSIILTYNRSAKIYKYIKLEEEKKCHTRNTKLCYVCDMFVICATQPISLQNVT